MRYIDTSGLSSAAVAICDRCKRKVALVKLVPDPNALGLRVCEDTCVDEFDPYRLPPRVTENVTLQYPRPEEPLVTPQIIETESEDWITTETGDPLETES